MRFIPRVTPYIIGEIGACHEGSLMHALDLIKMAAGAGCHAVKFQIYNAAELSSRRNAQFAFEMYRKYQVPLNWLPPLKVAAYLHGVDLVLSVFHVGIHRDVAVETADIIKISSFESEDSELGYLCTYHGKPLILSTGLSVRADLLRLKLFRAQTKTPVALLHCISAYPAPVEELQLATILHEDLDGYSDHSGMMNAGAVAVANGAKIIEVHIRDTDTKPDNPDYKHSLSPRVLTNYIAAAQQAKTMTGLPRTGITHSENQNLRYKVKPVEAI